MGPLWNELRTVPIGHALVDARNQVLFGIVELSQSLSGDRHAQAQPDLRSASIEQKVGLLEQCPTSALVMARNRMIGVAE